MKRKFYLSISCLLFLGIIQIAGASNMLENTINMLEKAKNAEKSGSCDIAIYYYDQLLIETPNDSNIHGLKGMVYLDCKADYQQAIYEFSTAINNNTKETDIYMYRGIARMKSGDIDGALTDLNQTIQLRAKNKTPSAFAYCTRALINSMKGNYQSAVEDSTNAIKLQPKYPEAFHFRGLAKLSIALKQYSQSYMQSAIQDLNYAKEQCLQLGNYDEYQGVMETYKRALIAQQVLEKELQNK